MVENLQGGLILRLPLEKVEEAVSKLIMISAMQTDDNLCNGMEQFLDNLRLAKDRGYC